ncbi:MAG: LamG-like jellyroll fold domain-containing protein [Pseudomonadota bacterium]
MKFWVISVAVVGMVCGSVIKADTSPSVSPLISSTKPELPPVVQARLSKMVEQDLLADEKLLPNTFDAGTGQEFGFSVATDGDLLVVGVPFLSFNYGPDGGGAYVFGRNVGGADNWGQIARLLPNPADIDARAVPVSDINFGISVAISGDTIAVGAPGYGLSSTAQGPGAAFIFQRDEGGTDNWGQVVQLQPNGLGDGAEFGASVSLDGDTLAVGAPQHNTGTRGGLVAVWPFQNNLNDFLGVHNGIAVGAIAYDAGIFGDALDLRGVDAHVSIPTTVLNGQSACSITFFVSREQYSPDGANAIFANVGGGSLTSVLASLANDNTASFRLDGDSSPTPPIPLDNAWVHLAFTYDTATNVRSAYVDGVFHSSVVTSGRLCGSDMPSTIGARDTDGAGTMVEYHDGLIDEMMLYNRALTAEEVASVEAGFTTSFNGAVFIFERDNGGSNAWGQTREIKDDDTTSRFGLQTELSGDRLAVLAGGGADPLRVFSRNTGGANNWGQDAVVTPPPSGLFDPPPNQQGKSIAFSGTSLIALGRLNSSGQTWLFEETTGWSFDQTLTVCNGPNVTHLVASPNTIAAGGNSGTATRVCVYERNFGGPDNWGIAANIANPAGQFTANSFGESLAISGSQLAIGARRTNGQGVNSNAGAVYVHYQDEGGTSNWGEIDRVDPEDYLTPSELGIDLDRDGDYLIVGARSDANQQGVDAGAGYVYERVNNSWQFATQLTGNVADDVGSRVAISGTTALVSDQGNSNDGTVHVFQREFGAWVRVTELRPPEGGSPILFGLSVDIEGDTAVTADLFNVHIFSRNEGGPDNWGLVASSPADFFDLFGIQLDISPDATLVAVGATSAAENGKADSGAVYIFERDFGGPNNWGRRVKLFPNQLQAGDELGLDVHITNSRLFAGATNASTVSNNETGKVFIFDRDEGGADNWGLVDVLVPSLTLNTLGLGYAIESEGDRLAVGAPSIADAVLEQEGVTFLFERDPNTNEWVELAAIRASDGAIGNAFGTAVDLTGTTLTVGAPVDGELGERSGAAYVYALPDLQISAVTGPPISVADPLTGQVELGSTVQYTLDVTNIGDGAASAVALTVAAPKACATLNTDLSPGWTVVDPAPAIPIITYDLGDLASGASAQVSLSLNMDPADPIAPACELFTIDFGINNSATTGTLDYFGGNNLFPFLMDMIPQSNLPPELLSAIPDQSVPAGVDVMLDVSAFFEDPDMDAINYSISGLPASLNIDMLTGVISGVTTVADFNAAPFTLTVTATDPAGSGLGTNDTFDLDLTNVAPTLVATPPTYSTVLGEDLLIDLAPFFEDADGQPLNYSLSGSPAYSVSNFGQPALLRGVATTTQLQQSPLTLSLRVFDDFGGQLTQPITINVFDQLQSQFSFERYFPALQQPWYFSDIQDVVTAADDTVYLADAERGKVMRFSKDGLLITQWGQLGADPGQFTFLSLALAVGPNGDVYAASGSRLQVFRRNGELISETDYLDDIIDVVLDNAGQLYLLFADRVEIRAAEQRSLLVDTVPLNRPPASLVVDDGGVLYVSQRSPSSAQDNDLIIRFSPPSYTAGSGINTTDADDLTLGPLGHIYAVGSADGVVRAYDSNGAQTVDNDISAIGGSTLKSIAFGTQARSYIANGETVFGVDPNTNARAFAWQSASDDSARFDQPLDVAVGAGDNLYVLEASNSRIQKFARNGSFQMQWPLQQPIANPATARAYVYASGFSPVRVLVATGAALELYDAGGNLITPNPFAVSGLNQPGPMDETGLGDLVLSDISGPGTTIYVVSQAGIVDRGPWTAPTCAASDLAVSPNNLVYLLCEPGVTPVEIQVYTLDGQAVPAANINLTNVGNPRSLNVDGQGRLYLTTTQTTISPQGVTAVDSLVQVLRSDGAELGQVGASGFAAARFDFGGELAGVDVNSQGDLFLVEPGNNRVQILNPLNLANNTKAIVVAGGGDYPENFLWEATQINANNAYDKLSYQGFTSDRILYLHPDPNLDLDGNPATIEIAGAPTRANLEDAITNWAADADNLVVYLADHGDKEVFRMNPEEVLDSGTLSAWLADLQDGVWPGRAQPPLGNDGWITIVYEACESGTFQDNLAPVNGEATNKRVVITTSSSDQNASFIAQGLLSFSYQFWINVFNGANVYDAYTLASATIADAYPQQAPLLSVINGGAQVSNVENFFASGTFAARVIGNGTANTFSGPDIVNPTATLVGGATAQIEIPMVSDNDGVSRVWAIVEPPEYMVRDAENPVLELPTFDLGMDCGPGIEFCGTFDGFTSVGEYRIEVLAQDIFGNVTRYPNRQQPVPDPELTLTVGNPLTNKAALLVMGDGSARGQARLRNGDFAYQALLRQDFLNDLDPLTPNVTGQEDEIRYYTQGQFAGQDVGVPSIEQLNNLLTGEFIDADTQHFVLVLLGDASDSAVEGLAVPGSQPILTSELSTFLDNVEAVIQGKIAVILEGSNTGALIPQLSAASDRRLLVAAASAGEQASLLGSGGISFSRYFWNAIRDGFSLGTAFQLANTAVRAGVGDQNPVLDDNGNGIANDPTDRIAARQFFIGPGLARAGNGPLIGRLMPDLVIANENVTQAQILAENVTSTSDVAVGVVGSVRVPGTSLQLGTFELQPVAGNKGAPVINLGDYVGSFDGFTAAGDYDIAVFAVDDKGNPSSPRRTTLRKTAGGDIFEVDDAPANATPLIADAAAQRHTLHTPQDEDWLLVALGDPQARVLNLSFNQLDAGLQLRAEVFDASRLTDPQAASLLTELVTPSALGVEIPIPNSLTAGLYLVRVSRESFSPTPNSDPSPGYSVGLASPFGDLGGLLTGTITDAVSGDPIGLALVTAVAKSTQFCGTATCDAAAVPTCDRAVCGNLGGFRLLLNQGEYDLRVQADGYETRTVNGFRVQPGGTTLVVPDPVMLEPEAGATPPTITLDSATAAGETEVSLTATVNANDSQTTGRFLLGPDSAALAPVSPSFVVTGNQSQGVSAVATGLTCSTAYIISATAENAGGQAAGGELMVTTADCGSTGIDVVFANGFE